LIAYIQTC